MLINRTNIVIICYNSDLNFLRFHQSRYDLNCNDIHHVNFLETIKSVKIVLTNLDNVEDI